MNPHRPEICQVLALGKYLLANPQVIEGTDLFNSSVPYHRFSKALRKCLEDNEQLFIGFSIDIDDIGMHSSRKWAGTHCSTGSTVSLSIASIYLKADWSMGPVRDRKTHL